MTALDREAFSVPKPSVVLVVATLLLYLLLATEIGPWFDLDVSEPTMAPVHVVLALALYAAILTVVSRGSPLLWHDQSRFRHYVEQAYPGSSGATDGDATEYLRALSWRTGSITIAQHIGFVAGAAAGMTFIGRSWPLALLVYAGVGLSAGLIAKALLGARDRTFMEARLAEWENGAARE